jgi:HlyD family secretion protein
MTFAEKTKSFWGRSLLNRVVLVAPPVALLVLAGYWKFALGESVQYYTAKVEKGDIAQVVQSTGTINAVTTVQVGSQVSGIISEIFVDFNSQVRKGQVIAQIDPSILRARLQQAEADLTNAQANVRNIEAQIETQRADLVAAQAGVDRARATATEAELNLKRTKELFEQGIVAASTRDTVQANYDGAVASLKVAEAQVEQSRARLRSMQASLEQARAQVAQRRAAAELARVDLGHAVITAPIDGTVIARNVDVGQTVAASLQAPTLFIIAQDLTKMLVYVKTDEADVGKVKPGAMATFRVDSFPREMFRGQVIQVRMNATTVQNVVTYDTIVEFENPERKLFPGMTATVTIPVAVASDVVKIPNGALRFRPDMTDEQRREILAKYNIQESLAQRGQAAGGVGASAGGQQSVASAGGRTGSGEGNSGGGERRMGSGMGGGTGRVDTGVVWKLVNKKDLVPAQVRLGVTDFTFTEMKAGELNPCLPGKNDPCDELVIGQSSNRSGNTGSSPTGPSNRPPGMGGPMRRM